MLILVLALVLKDLLRTNFVTLKELVRYPEILRGAILHGWTRKANSTTTDVNSSTNSTTS